MPAGAWGVAPPSPLAVPATWSAPASAPTAEGSPPRGAPPVSAAPHPSLHSLPAAPALRNCWSYRNSPPLYKRGVVSSLQMRLSLLAAPLPAQYPHAPLSTQAMPDVAPFMDNALADLPSRRPPPRPPPPSRRGSGTRLSRPRRRRPAATNPNYQGVPHRQQTRQSEFPKSGTSENLCEIARRFFRLTTNFGWCWIVPCGVHGALSTLGFPGPTFPRLP